MDEIELTTEQEFSIRSLEERAKTMTKDELIEMFSYCYRTMLINEKFYQQMLGKAWGILP